MKVKEVEVKEKKEFEPFSIEITFETPEEARLMFHIANRMHLKDCIFSEDYMKGEYNMDISKTFDQYPICEIIQNHIDV